MSARERQGEQAAHAIADQPDPPVTGKCDRRLERLIEAAGDVIRQVEAPLHLARDAPVYQQAAQAAAAQVAQKAALFIDIQDIGAIDQ